MPAQVERLAAAAHSDLVRPRLVRGRGRGRRRTVTSYGRACPCENVVACSSVVVVIPVAMLLAITTCAPAPSEYFVVRVVWQTCSHAANNHVN